MAEFDLFRYTHPDGSSKDWAIRCNGDGSITTRWGPTGPVLPQSSTRRQDKLTLEKSKRRKGYVNLGPVNIDHIGRVGPTGNTASGPSPVEPELRDDAVYWRINVQASVSAQDLLGWSRHVTGAANRLAQVLTLERTGRTDFEPGTLGTWTIPSTRESAAGRIRREQGIVPLLVLMAMKQLAPAGVTVSLATEDGIEIGTDLRAESGVLTGFDTDLEQVRPLAEALRLLQPRIDLAEAIQDGPDAWF